MSTAIVLCNDSLPKFEVMPLPLPISHSGIEFTVTPFWVQVLEASSKKIAEIVEKTYLGWNDVPLLYEGKEVGRTANARVIGDEVVVDVLTEDPQPIYVDAK